MKKILLSFTTVGLAALSLAPLANNRQNKIEEPYSIIEKDFTYTYNFKNLDFDSCDWSLDENGINSCTLTDEEFTKSLQNLITEIFDFVKSQKFATVEYKVTSITSSYNSKTDSIRSEPELFTSAIKIENKTEEAMAGVIVKNQSITFERSYSQYIGYTYYVKNINAEIENKGQTYNDINLYGIPFNFPITEIDDLKTTFTNTFHFELVLVIDLTFTDTSFNSQIGLPTNLYFQYPEQILGFFNKEENQDQRTAIIDYINNKLSISIKSIDEIVYLYEANFNSEKNQYEAGENISQSESLYKEPYFYLGITSNKEAIGEFKILIKNTNGKQTF